MALENERETEVKRYTEERRAEQQEASQVVRAAKRTDRQDEPPARLEEQGPARERMGTRWRRGQEFCPGATPTSRKHVPHTRVQARGFTYSHAHALPPH